MQIEYSSNSYRIILSKLGLGLYCIVSRCYVAKYFSFDTNLVRRGRTLIVFWNSVVWKTRLQVAQSVFNGFNKINKLIL